MRIPFVGRQQSMAVQALPLSASPQEIQSVETTTPEQRLTEVGSTGTINYQGFLQSEEYNKELLPPDSFAVYDRMAVSDPTVRALMLHLSTPIKAAEWRIQPASDDPLHLEQAAFIHNNLFEWMKTPWDDCMEDQLKYLRWGVSVLEEVWEHQKVGWEYHVPGQAESVKVPPRDVYTLRKMAPRLPRTIFRWINDPKTQDLAVVQTRAWRQDSLQYLTTDIPADKCLILSNEKVGDDWWGVSMLRGAYKPWWILEAMQRVTAIGMERFYVGTPMARMNQNATDSQRNKMLNILSALRSGERAAVVYSASDGLDCETEGAVTSSGGNSHAIWILQPDKTPPDSTAWIRQLEGNIFTSIMARFMDLGQKETGARATAEIQDDPFYLGLVAVANHIAETWNRGTIKRLIDANYPNVDRYPSLEASRIAPEDIPVIAAAAAAYAGSGFLTPDFVTEQWIRSQLNMPDKVLTDDQDVGDDDQTASNTEAAKQYPSILGIAAQQAKAAASAPAGAGGGGAGKFARPPIQARTTSNDGGSGTTLGDDPLAPSTFRRDVHPDEEHVDFGEISARVDNARNSFYPAIQPALQVTHDRLYRDLSESASSRDVAGSKAKDLGGLTNSIHDSLVSIAGYGYHSVESEIGKQRGMVALAEPMHDDLVARGSIDHIRRVSESAAASIGAGLEQVGKTEALAQIRRHGSVVNTERLHNVIGAEANRQAQLHAMLLSTEALNIGRQTAADVHADDIQRVRYTSLMDRAACGPCEAADGTTTYLNSDLYKSLDPPNPNCQGGPRCRCIWVYLT